MKAGRVLDWGVVPVAAAAMLLFLCARSEVARAADAEPSPSGERPKEYPIDPATEPLGAAVERLNLWEPVLKSFLLSIDPTSVVSVAKLDAHNEPVAQTKTVSGQSLRDSFIMLKAVSLDSERDENLREMARKSVENAIKNWRPKPDAPTYSIDAQRDHLASSLKAEGQLSQEEIGYVESINPDATEQLTQFDDRGNVQYVMIHTRGLVIRQAMSAIIARRDWNKLDDDAKRQLNLYLYDQPVEPANATEPPARIMAAIKWVLGKRAADKIARKNLAGAK